MEGAESREPLLVLVFGLAALIAAAMVLRLAPEYAFEAMPVGVVLLALFVPDNDDWRWNAPLARVLSVATRRRGLREVASAWAPASA